VILSTSDIQNLPKPYRTQLINAISGPKPIHIVGTLSASGQTNAAIFSSIVHLGADPPLLGMISRPDIVDRHTLRNIRETGMYTLNMVGFDWYQKAHQTSARYPADVSEFDAVDLKVHFQEGFIAPFVADANIRLGMKLLNEIPIPQNGCTFIIGQIELLMIEKDIIQDDGWPDLHLANIASCVGLDAYFKIPEIIRLPYAKP
jgi:flavin reductase (DIM6/NTAB) family NADH-FMN oxidoreductase RutF